MKVLMVNDNCGRSSTGRLCTCLADVLSDSGHTVKIAYGRQAVPEKYRNCAIRIGSQCDVYAHALENRIFDNTGAGSGLATKMFLKQVEAYDPDIIHLHNIHGYYINIELLFRYITDKRKPVIWTLHDCWSFTGHCAYFTYADCDKWKGGCYDCPSKREYPASLFRDNSRKNWQMKNCFFTGVQDMTLVTPSKWLADLTRESFLNKYPVEVINNNIDTAVFKPVLSDFKKRVGIEGKKVILGVACPWNARKGFDDFIKLSKVIDDNCRIVLIGLSDKQLKCLPQGVIGIKRTNDVNELAEIYTAADVFVNFTYADNYPTVNLEAQACGTPVISYRTGGSVESVPPENVIPVGDYKAVIPLLDAPLRLFHIEDKSSMAGKYMELYEKIIHSH